MRVSVKLSSGSRQEGAKSAIGGALGVVEVGEGHRSLAGANATLGDVKGAEDKHGEGGSLPVVRVEPLGVRSGVDEVVIPLVEEDTVDGTGLEHNVVVVHLLDVVENGTGPPWHGLNLA